MKTLIAAAFILGVLACAGAVLMVEPSCPWNFELETVNGSCMCKCVPRERPCFNPRHVFDLDTCRCRCDCPYGVEDTRTCTCRSVPEPTRPVPEPTRPGSCVGSRQCRIYKTEFKCTSNSQCVWREGSRKG